MRQINKGHVFNPLKEDIFLIQFEFSRLVFPLFFAPNCIVFTISSIDWFPLSRFQSLHPTPFKRTFCNKLLVREIPANSFYLIPRHEYLSYNDNLFCNFHTKFSVLFILWFKNYYLIIHYGFSFTGVFVLHPTSMLRSCGYFNMARYGLSIFERDANIFAIFNSYSVGRKLVFVVMFCFKTQVAFLHWFNVFLPYGLFQYQIKDPLEGNLSMLWLENIGWNLISISWNISPVCYLYLHLD